ncbi:MAG: ABC transporter substrate-binding protein [Candidatus Hodarchaeales archaeon]|jgi:ABC-type transport system substrate-binding protein
MRKKIVISFIPIFVMFFLVPSGFMVGLSPTKQNPLKVNATRTDTWILDLQDNFNNPQWFYDNLNQVDRQKIRQAMDYAIPRQDIIDVILDGMGQPLATPIIPQSGEYFNSSITARPFDPQMSLNLLEEVFGYRYNEWSDDPATPYREQNPYFPMTAIIPSTSQLRSLWAGQTAFSWQSIGIDVTQKHLNWDVSLPRLYFNPVGIGYDYAHGGFDTWFVGFGAEPTPIVRSLFHTDHIIPNGDNYYFLNDTSLNDIIDRTMYSADRADRIAATHEFQQYFYDYIPTSIIRQEIETWGIDEDLSGFNPFGIWYFENITHPTQSTISISIPAEIRNSNPLFSNYYFDAYVFDAITGGRSRGGLFSSMTPDGDNTFTQWESVPYLTKDWTVSADKKTWEINLHAGLTWHDGAVLDANDIVFTYQSMMTPDVGSVYYNEITDVFGSNSSITKINTTAVRFIAQNPHPFMKEIIFRRPILPEHVLGAVIYTDWTSHWTNIPTETQGPIGYGPYKFTSKNFTTGDITLEKWDSYPAVLNRSSISSVQTIKIIRFSDPAAALTGLFNGEIDIVDSQTGLSAFINQIVSPAKAINYLEYGYQEVGYNQYSPIWGINPGNPLEMYGVPPTSASVTETVTETVPVTEITTVVANQTVPITEVITETVPVTEIITETVTAGIVATEVSTETVTTEIPVISTVTSTQVYIVNQTITITSTTTVGGAGDFTSEASGFTVPVFLLMITLVTIPIIRRRRRK